MKSLACRDLGKECDFIATGMTEDEVMQQIKDHGIKDHAMSDADFTPEMMEKEKSLVKDA